MSVEGDYSQAAFPAVLGTLTGGVAVTGLSPDSHQGDKVILDILRRCGGKFSVSADGVRFERSLLRAAPIDLAELPRPGPGADGHGLPSAAAPPSITNAGRLRLKESDRIAAMQTELAKFGGKVKSSGGTITIEGGALHAPETPLDGHNDHRGGHEPGGGGTGRRRARPHPGGKRRGQKLAGIFRRHARHRRPGGTDGNGGMIHAGTR